MVKIAFPVVVGLHLSFCVWMLVGEVAAAMRIFFYDELTSSPPGMHVT
jgi:hypothetical protein